MAAAPKKDDLKTKFQAAAAAAKQTKKRPDNATLLKLYAYYKQATEGDARGDRIVLRFPDALVVDVDAHAARAFLRRGGRFFLHFGRLGRINGWRSGQLGMRQAYRSAHQQCGNPTPDGSCHSFHPSFIGDAAAAVGAAPDALRFAVASRYQYSWCSFAHVSST